MMADRARKKILVVDDEQDLCQLLTLRLQDDGYDVVLAVNGLEAIEKVVTELPDLMILDLSLPGCDGFEVCKQVKKDERTAKIPIVMLTARNTVTDEVLGLEIGAEDYVVKPFEYRVLQARIKKQLLKAQETASALKLGGSKVRQDKLQFGPIHLDVNRQRIRVDDQEFHLTTIESRILRLFLEKPGHVYSRDDLVREAWQGEGGKIEGRTVDVHINNLRKKLLTHADLIETVYGSGYNLRVS